MPKRILLGLVSLICLSSFPASSNDPMECDLAVTMNAYDVGLAGIDALYLTATNARQAGDLAAVARLHKAIDCAKSDVIYAGTALQVACAKSAGNHRQVMARWGAALQERCEH